MTSHRQVYRESRSRGDARTVRAPVNRIEDYALIGDTRTGALVSREGSIDWLCWPRFDGAACFASLLGDAANGHWRIAPRAASPRITRRYQDGGMVLETIFETDEGAAALIDFMPLGREASSVVRLVRGLRGQVRMRMSLALRFDYGLSIPWVTRLDDGLGGGGITAIAGPDQVALCTPVKLRGRRMTTVAAFSVSEGETVPFTLSHAASHLPVPAPFDAEAALVDTAAAWQAWSSRCSHDGRWREAVTRSLVTLKALTYAPTGGMVAAATTSLPERIGGERNWDYRFCWLRDATITLLAMMNGGYFEEARDWSSWLHRAIAGSAEQIQIMYGLAGERRLDEWTVPWLAGYEGSRPVRIGNAAAGQVQLDVYGEVMDCLHHARAGKLQTPHAAWSLQRSILEHLDGIWREPDEGIWEVRGGRRHFTFSKVMAWVAFDRSIRDAERYRLNGPVEHWREVRREIHATVCREGIDTARGSFTQSFGDTVLDASLLLIPIVGFLPIEDERVTATVEAIEDELLADGFVLRYRTDKGNKDGLSAGEGAFLACSFWLAEVYAMQGRRDEAEALFERLLALRNDVGLLSEEYDPAAGRQVGNVPQAFSHVALIATAMQLSATCRKRAPREDGERAV